MRPSIAAKRKFCDHECARQASVGKPIDTPHFRHGQDIRQKHTSSILGLYAQRIGHRTIANQLGLSERITRTILIEQGVYKPGWLHPLKGQGKPLPKPFGRALMMMRIRVRRCLDKNPPRPKSPTYGMTEAQAFHWRYHNVPKQRIYELLRRRMKKVIKEGVKRGRSLELLGCTTDHIRAHLEAQFKRGMTWCNMGTGKGLWHIDHIIPCAAFDLTREDQQRICFHWTNLRPMWSLDNMRKGKRLERHATPCFAL